MEKLTLEEITQNYKAMMDSVELINAGKPDEMSDQDWVDCVKRNREHLELMLEQDYWTNEDLEVVKAVL